MVYILCVLTSVSVKALTLKVQELESKVEVTDDGNIPNDSVVTEDVPVGDQEYDEEDDDDETIEEEPGFSSDGDHDLFSEQSDTETETEDELTEKKGKRCSTCSMCLKNT